MYIIYKKGSNTYLNHHDSGASDNECGSGKSNNSNGGGGNSIVSSYNTFQSTYLAKFRTGGDQGGGMIKEENLENDEEFFRIMSNGNNQMQTRPRTGFISK